MTRETSILAFEQAKASGLVGRRHLQLLHIVAVHGPMTANEAFNVLKDQMGSDFRFDSNTRARFTEMRDLGVIEEAPARECKITGRECIVWKLTGRAPVKVQRKTARQRIAELEDQIVLLRREIEQRTFQPGLL